MKASPDFLNLTPENILDSVEQVLQKEEPELRATGRAQALNSLENRVYDVELEDNSSVVAKFYRPMRWSREQILEEHEFLFQLEEAEIPVISPLFIDGESLFENKEGILFTLFPKVRGRLLDELGETRLKTLGRYIGRIHSIGERFPFSHRKSLSVEEWGWKPLNNLLASDFLPSSYRSQYEFLAKDILEKAESTLKNCQTLSLHGDCHLGNTLWQQDSPFFLDFDDSMAAPPVQDIWMVSRGRDTEAILERNQLLEGYEIFRPFPRISLDWIEYLRALRLLHYSHWISQRWDDPSFPKAFPLFGTPRYWEEEIQALQEIQFEIKP